MKRLLLIVLPLLLIVGCGLFSDPEIDVVITYDQYYNIFNGIPFHGKTDIEYVIGNTGDVDISNYSITIECINSESETGNVVVSGLNLNTGQNHEGNTELSIIDPHYQIEDCYLKSQTLDGETTDF
jgi:hypothetical protein